MLSCSADHRWLLRCISRYDWLVVFGAALLGTGDGSVRFSNVGVTESSIATVFFVILWYTCYDLGAGLKFSRVFLV